MNLREIQLAMPDRVVCRSMWIETDLLNKNTKEDHRLRLAAVAHIVVLPVERKAHQMCNGHQEVLMLDNRAKATAARDHHQAVQLFSDLLVVQVATDLQDIQVVRALPAVLVYLQAQEDRPEEVANAQLVREVKEEEDVSLPFLYKV